jgi:hypothetical protein
VVALASVSCVLAAQNAASAAPAKPSSSSSSALADLGLAVSADGWISYTKPQANTLPLTNVKVKTVKESRTPAGDCSITSDSTPVAAGTYTEQIAFNPNTCQSKILVGTLDPATMAKLMATTGGAGVDKTAPVAGAATKAGVVTPAVTYYETAHTQTKWIDPVNIDITWLGLNFTWPLYGAGGTLSANATAYAFPYDGWSKSGPYFGPFTGVSGGWYISSNAHFINYDFAALVIALLGISGWLACGAPTSTRADFYHNVTVYGYSNDTKNHAWNDSKSGACSNLVHHQSLTGYGNF